MLQTPENKSEARNVQNCKNKIRTSVDQNGYPKFLSLATGHSTATDPASFLTWPEQWVNSSDWTAVRVETNSNDRIVRVNILSVGLIRNVIGHRHDQVSGAGLCVTLTNIWPLSKTGKNLLHVNDKRVLQVCTDLTRIYRASFLRFVYIVLISSRADQLQLGPSVGGTTECLANINSRTERPHARCTQQLSSRGLPLLTHTRTVGLTPVMRSSIDSSFPRIKSKQALLFLSCLISSVIVSSSPGPQTMTAGQNRAVTRLCPWTMAAIPYCNLGSAGEEHRAWPGVKRRATVT
ncbi:hypothetical protein RRG08_014214 [Elysia crispata]|uniref:Uncharacterized protein n=1 Tax=Elysia crispata TaxID=231223 RepID=A0AAE1CEU9_9GAST|nr:hypothetical protein RRG08_014214 [Elysia crispata]